MKTKKSSYHNTENASKWKKTATILPLKRVGVYKQHQICFNPWKIKGRATNVAATLTQAYYLCASFRLTHRHARSRFVDLIQYMAASGKVAPQADLCALFLEAEQWGQTKGPAGWFMADLSLLIQKSRYELCCAHKRSIHLQLHTIWKIHWVLLRLTTKSKEDRTDYMSYLNLQSCNKFTKS